MKKVLLISYYFPPRPGVASNRTGGLAKFLPQFGWEPLILTPKLRAGTWPSYARVIETEGSSSVDAFKQRAGIKDKNEQLQSNTMLFGFAKTIGKGLFREIVCYPDEHKSMIPSSMKIGEQVINDENIEAIISSASPVSTHIAASRLAARAGLPWIADFRDLWTQSHNYKYTAIRHCLESRLEKQTMRSAHALVTVSEPLAVKLRVLHQQPPVFSITNGFDPDEIRTADKASPKFTITYTGQIYAGKQDPSLLFAAIQNLTKTGALSGDNLAVDFYGPYSEVLSNTIRQFGLEDIVRQHGIVDRLTAIEKQRESSVLLLLNWNDPAEEGIYTGKIFEYLAARRPILAFGGKGGVVAELLDQTRTGVFIYDSETLSKLLLAWYGEFTRTGWVGYEPKNEMVQQYSQVTMAQKFAVLLNGVSNS